MATEAPEARATRHARARARRALTMPPLALTRDQWATVERRAAATAATTAENGGWDRRNDMHALWNMSSALREAARVAQGKSTDDRRINPDEFEELPDGRISHQLGSDGLAFLDDTGNGVAAAVQAVYDEHKRMLAEIEQIGR